MKCRYIHEGTDNYMVVDNENAVYEDDYRIKMLKNNKIPGLMEFKTEYVNNKAVYYYDITGMKSLKQISDTGALGYEEIVIIIKKINSLINDLKGCLLPADSIVLDLEYIFMDTESGTPYFCYNPAYILNIEESIRELFRNFLGIIDHSDRRTVELAYDIYCQSMKENFTIAQIIESVKGKKVYEEPENSGKNILRENANNEDDGNDEDGGNEGIIKQIKKIFKKLLGEDKYMDNIPEDIPENLYYESDETRLIGDMGYSIDSGISLTNISDGEVIFIPGCPCVVGKSVDKCDVIINKSVISRIHMKFMEDNNVIYIEDMGSSNGTFLNDVRLKPHERYGIKSDDRIRMADMEYIYHQVH